MEWNAKHALVSGLAKLSNWNQTQTQMKRIPHLGHDSISAIICHLRQDLLLPIFNNEFILIPKDDLNQ